MKRYDIEMHEDDPSSNAVRFNEAEDGEWVDADEAIAKIESLRREIERLRSVIDEIHDYSAAYAFADDDSGIDLAKEIGVILSRLFEEENSAKGEK